MYRTIHSTCSILKMKILFAGHKTFAFHSNGNMMHHLYKKKSSAHEKSISFSLNKNHSIVALYVPIYFSKKKTSSTSNTEIEKTNKQKNQRYIVWKSIEVFHSPLTLLQVYISGRYRFLSFFWSTNPIRRIAFDSWTACILSLPSSLLFYHSTFAIVPAPLFHCIVVYPFHVHVAIDEYIVHFHSMDR